MGQGGYPGLMKPLSVDLRGLQMVLLPFTFCNMFPELQGKFLVAVCWDER